MAPSDMMDGRVAAMRETLDADGFEQTPILSYASKFSSAFTDHSVRQRILAPQFGDRSSFTRWMERICGKAMREIELDLAEGADMLLMKGPAMPYLDVIRAACERFDLP